ncbi:hypothetical protein [Ferrimonas pelagia]|uniref:Uncharacterized protein n=1 Tax=Ferrimonas pelagia TaxID=1177826 RepID=A0ABP9EL16_9GAMM
MKWLRGLFLVFQAALREFERHRAEAKQIRRENRANEIKADPDDAAADRVSACWPGVSHSHRWRSQRQR